MLGSVLLITDPASDPDPAPFWQWFSRSQQKMSCFSKFFCLFLNVGKLTSVFKDNMSLRSHKTVEFMVYLNFLLVDRRIRIRKPALNHRISYLYKNVCFTCPYFSHKVPGISMYN